MMSTLIFVVKEVGVEFNTVTPINFDEPVCGQGNACSFISQTFQAVTAATPARV